MLLWKKLGPIKDTKFTADNSDFISFLNMENFWLFTTELLKHFTYGKTLLPSQIFN